jgi:hypothetical protein
MIDHAVPRNARERLPLLVVDGIIAAIWWNGWTVSEQFAVDERSERVLYFGFGTYSDAPPESP